MGSVDWRIDTLVGGTPADTVLFLPGFMRYQDGKILVYDYGDARLKVFRAEGDWLWSYGLFGDGPGEFKNPTDVAITGEEEVLILDRGAGRVTTLSSDGAFRQVRRIDESAWRLVSFPGGVLVFPGGSGEALMRLTTRGDSQVSFPYPTPGLRSTDPRLRFVEVSTPSNGVWAVGFSRLNVFLVFHETELVCRGTLFEGMEVGSGWEPDAAYVDSFMNLSVGDSTVEVYSHLPGDSTVVVVDRFSATDCDYSGSTVLRLPGIAAAVARREEELLVLSRDPVPAIFLASDSRERVPESSRSPGRPRDIG